MSILDGLADQDLQAAALAGAGRQLKAMLESESTTPKMRSILEAMAEGLSLGDIVGISKEHRDALLIQGGTMLRAGDLMKAQDVLTLLSVLEPLDERPIYMLGVIAQLRENVAVAARLFVNFLALDATNPDGYLRLGECLLTAGELDDAEDAFKSALTFAREAGKADRVAHAEKMLDILKARRTGNA